MEGLSADLRALERSLGAAIVASLPLQAPERPAFIGRHLLAQLDDAPLPVAEGEERTPTKDEFRQLEELLSKHLNATKGMAGWPARCLAARLMLDDPTVAQQQPPPEERAHAPTAAQAEAAAEALRVHEAVVAKANALALDERPEDGGVWSMFGGAWLEPLLEHTTLIDARYLLALADAGGIVPRWQELPEAARITPANVWRLKAAVGPGQLPVLVLSYPWLDKDHPDRMGETLRRVAPVLRAWLAWVTKECSEHCTIGVLWDYTSLPQRPYDDDGQQARFKRGLTSIDKWYSHPCTVTLRVTNALPTGAEYTNTRPYERRGWCFFETHISAIAKNSMCLLDLNELKDAEQDWHGMWMQMRSSRRPFVSPDDIAAEMSAGVASGALAFTAGADEAFVIGKYRTGFLDAFTQHTTRQQDGGAMSFNHLGWGDAEAAVLVRAIAYAVRHCEFEEGAAHVELFLQHNKFGEEAKAAIRGACGGKIVLDGI